MSELTIGSIGTRLDLELRAGNTLGPYIDGATKITYVYQMRHSGADLFRMMII